MAQRKPPTSYMSQREKFIKAAREHGASEDADVFRKAVRQIAAARPMPRPKATKETQALNRPRPGAQGLDP